MQTESRYVFELIERNSNDPFVVVDDTDRTLGTLEVTGTGMLRITNTGGSSASEGGMGSGSDDDREKGSLSKPGEKSGSGSSSPDDSDTSFDPIKKNIKEAERNPDKE
jgi:hypothetical protein